MVGRTLPLVPQHRVQTSCWPMPKFTTRLPMQLPTFPMSMPQPCANAASQSQSFHQKSGPKRFLVIRGEAQYCSEPSDLALKATRSMLPARSSPYRSIPNLVRLTWRKRSFCAPMNGQRPKVYPARQKRIWNRPHRSLNLTASSHNWTQCLSR